LLDTVREGVPVRVGDLVGEGFKNMLRDIGAVERHHRFNDGGEVLVDEASLVEPGDALHELLLNERAGGVRDDALVLDHRGGGLEPFHASRLPFRAFLGFGLGCSPCCSWPLISRSSASTGLLRRPVLAGRPDTPAHRDS
jgi:hypothetical protein